MNSWGGSGAAIPILLFPPLLPGSGSAALSYLGVCQSNNRSLELCGWRAFSALRQIIEEKRSVFSPKWVYEENVKAHSRIVPWGSTETWAGDRPLPNSDV